MVLPIKKTPSRVITELLQQTPKNESKRRIIVIVIVIVIIITTKIGLSSMTIMMTLIWKAAQLKTTEKTSIAISSAIAKIVVLTVIVTKRRLGGNQ